MKLALLQLSADFMFYLGDPSLGCPRAVAVEICATDSLTWDNFFKKITYYFSVAVSIVLYFGATFEVFQKRQTEFTC